VGTPRDLASLSASDFQAVVGSDFRVSAGPSGPLDLRLIQVVELGERPGQRRPFILRFQGPPSPVLAQVVHRLEHPDMGDVEIFVGPIGTDAQATIYEAVFA
jgi:hypothetical protein